MVIFGNKDLAVILAEYAIPSSDRSDSGSMPCRVKTVVFVHKYVISDCDWTVFSAHAKSLS